MQMIAGCLRERHMMGEGVQEYCRNSLLVPDVRYATKRTILLCGRRDQNRALTLHLFAFGVKPRSLLVAY